MKSIEEVSDLYEKFVMPTYAPGVALVRGHGSKVWDTQGKVYLDFAAGIAVLNLGHCHPAVVDAIQRQAGELMHVSNLYYNQGQADLAAKLSALAGGGKCFFCNSGAEANEALIKLARAWGSSRGKGEVVAMRNSFHGRTLGAMAATGQEKIQKGFGPMPVGFGFADLNDLDSVEAAISGSTAAILIEAVQGEGGVIPAEPDFMQGLRALCDEREILLLCDEVQCGMGRTGRWFGFEHGGIKPDAFALAKALGNGFPIGAVVAADSCAEVFQVGMHASTFGGTPLACAAALATIETIEKEDLVSAAAKTGIVLRDGLQKLVDRYEHVTSVRGIGLLLGLELDQPAKPVVDRMFDIGLITIPTAERVIRLVPPLNVATADIDEALDIMDDVLSEWHAEQADSEEPQSAAAPESVAATAGNS